MQSVSPSSELGKESEIDFNKLAKFGKVKKLSLDEIFGY